jgi:hypothetical protein
MEFGWIGAFNTCYTGSVSHNEASDILSTQVKANALNCSNFQLNSALPLRRIYRTLRHFQQRGSTTRRMSKIRLAPLTKFKRLG